MIEVILAWIMIIIIVIIIGFLIIDRHESEHKLYNLWVGYNGEWAMIGCQFAKNEESVDLRVVRLMYPDYSILVLHPWEKPYICNVNS